METTDKQIVQAFMDSKGNKTAAAKALHMRRTTYRDRLDALPENLMPIIEQQGKELFQQHQKTGQWVVESTGNRFETVEDVIDHLNIDMAIWKVADVSTSAWDVSMKIRSGTEEKPFTIQNTKLKIVFKRIVSETDETAISTLLHRIETKSPVVAKIRPLKLKARETRNALEISLMDLHYGLRCFTPESDAEWNPELAAQLAMESLKELVRLARPFAPFEELVLPFGNDFFHIDSFWGETTLGTRQPEADAYYHTFINGQTLALTIVDYLQKEFNVPIKIYMIPGNHDRNTSFMLGQILKAYYRNDPNIFIDASPAPYKFYEYGCNLIGYEHGHSINTVRLAALMANECHEAWARTQFREWHLGDQHRKGSGKPSMLEEQGVSIEYLPSITAPNEWHKLKSFNWQKRGTMAFVWSHSRGQIARLQCNIDRYVDKKSLMGDIK